MANTVIALRQSGATGNTPSLGVLANGELSLNYADSILYFKTVSNTLGSIRTTQPAGLTTEIQFNDAGSFGSNTGLTFNKTTGVFTAPIVASSNNGSGTNFRVGDDAWIGDVNLADTLRISGQQNVNNAYVVFGASNANTLGRAGTGPLTYTGDFKATGLVSGNELTSTNSTGSEGGQVNLAIPASGTSLVSSVTIDVYGNQLRFFQGDSAKGAYIDLTATSAGVGTNLLNPTSTPDTVARETANAAFARANSANILAQASFNQANTDVTNISATAGVYGNASHVPVATLTANGRISSITNTAISIDTGAITSGTLAVARGGTGVTTSTGSGAVVLNTAPTITLPTINNIRQGYSTTVTAAGTTTLTVNSNYLQFFTGTTTQILSLPAPQTMTLGMGFLVVNNSTGSIEVRAANSATVATVLPGTAVLFVSIDLTAGNGAAGWSAEIVGFSSLTGTGAVVLNTSPTLSTPTVNRIDWPLSGFAQPSLTTRSSGTKLTLYPSLSSTSVDYAVGIDGGVLWSSIPAANSTFSFKWYGGESEITSLRGDGLFTTFTANLIGTTASTSNTTGALKVAGGIGVKGNVYADAVYSNNSAVVTKDIYNNVIVNNIVANTTTTTSSAGVTTLTVASSYVQVLTGSLSHTFDLPNATTLAIGAQYSFNNNSTGNLLVRSAGGATLFTLAAGGRLQVTLKSAGDSNGSWDLHSLIPSNASWGTATLAATSTNASFSGLTLTATTASTSNTTGALKVEGGIGVKGNVSANGIIFDDGTRQTTAASADGATLADVLALSIALG
jgi:hypothetical protein